MKHLVIIGVGGFAREVYWHAQESLGYGIEWDIKGYLDGDVKLSENEYLKLSAPLLGDVNTYNIDDNDVFVCAIGNPTAREKLVNSILEKGGQFINLIHKTALIHGTAKMGTGNILTSFACVNDHVVLGSHIIFNGRSGIGHDGKIDDFTSLMSIVDIQGNAIIGKRVFIASGVHILAHAKVEDDSYVGVGSVVFKKVKKGQKVFGNPAMPI